MLYTGAMIRLRRWRFPLLRLAGAGLCVALLFIFDAHVGRLREAARAPREIVFRASFLPAARRGSVVRVVLAGPFNGWSVADRGSELAGKGSGVWSISRVFPAGETQYKFVVYLAGRDRPVWVHNPDEPRWTDDGFGGRNSVLAVRDHGELQVLLHVVLGGVAGLLLLYSLVQLLFRWFFSSRLSVATRLLIVYAGGFVIAGAGIIWFNTVRQRQLVREGFAESLHLVQAALAGQGIDFRQFREPPESAGGRQVRRLLPAACDAVFARVRTRSGDSLYSGQGSSIHRLVLFDPEFRVVHIAAREELPIGSASQRDQTGLYKYYRETVFGALVARARGGEPPEGDGWYGVFGNTDRGEVSAGFLRDSRLLGFNIILRPLLQDAAVAGYCGVVLFPAVYAARIRENLLVNLGWCLLLILFGVACFLLRPRTQPLSPEMIGAFALRTGLTGREREIVDQLVRGTDYRTLADTLFISVKTVKAHVYNIYQKAGVGNRLELYEKIRKNS